MCHAPWARRISETYRCAGREFHPGYAELAAARFVAGGGSARRKSRLRCCGHHSSWTRGPYFSIDSPTAPLAAGVTAPAAFFTENRVTKATRLAPKARAIRQYMQTFRRLQKLHRAFDCEHGHFGCAAEPDGACTEELLHLIGKAADDCDIRR